MFSRRLILVLGVLAVPVGMAGCRSSNASGGRASIPVKRTAAPAAGEPLHFAVYGMSCESCAKTATAKLNDVPGVVEANVTFASKQAVVQAERGQVDLAAIQSALKTLGFEALPPGQKPPGPLPEETRKLLDIRVISHGARINVREHLSPGKITIFDYYADWCGPCHLLTPKLERLVVRFENTALRQVDIVNWQSAAAKQATAEFRLSGLPFTRVFDDRGILLGQVSGNDIDRIEAIVRSHAHPDRKRN